MTNEPTSPASPVAEFPPSPPEYRSRAPEFYGFVALTSTSFAFVIFLLWALVPDEYIVWVGIEWYPSREWALLLPSWTVVVVLLTYFAYASLTIYGIPAFDQISTITDSRAQFPETSTNVGNDFSDYASHAQMHAIPELYDIPIGLVNRVMYGTENNE